MSRIFGTVRQNGYVVHDIEKAMAHWTETLGVGPFFYVDKVPVENFTYRGTPSEAEFSIALANCGDLQIELIQQRNDAPSMYRDFLEAGREGLQHLAFWTEDYTPYYERMLARGFVVGQAGEIGAGGRFCYFDTETHPGTVIEISEISGQKGKLFARIREAATNWDGTDPIIRM